MKYRKYSLVLLASLLFLVSLPAQQAIDILKDDALFKHSQIGFSLIDISTGKEIQATNNHQFFYPASVQKLITTNLGLILIGKNFQYETKVFTTGSIEDGVLKGNIIIEASGDPTVNSRRFSNDFLSAMLNKLKSKKITAIEGQILLKKNQKSISIPQTWLYEDIANYYAAMPQLFNYKDNSYTISFASGNDNTTPKVNSITPEVPYSFEYTLKSSASIKGDRAYILGAPFSKKRKVIGTIPAQKAAFSIKGANANPLHSFSADVTKQIPIKSKVIESNNPTLLFSHKSENISKIAKQCNLYSDNFLAESILSTIGLSAHYDYNISFGLKAVENFIKISKLNQKEVILKDGSGLSRLNAITPHFMSDFLYTFFPHKDFVNTIAIASESGTMKKFTSSAIKGKILAKSGTATGAINYAGYINAANGKTYAFSLFINQIYESNNAVNQKIERFFESLVEIKE